MDYLDERAALAVSRRRLLKAAAVGAGALATPVLAQALADLRLPGGPSRRPLASGFPGKGEMIVQRVRPPLLETPFSVFDRDVFTPADQFFVRWHWADMPTSIDVESFRLTVRGAVRQPISISLAQLLHMPRVEIAAVNQCSGNSRGLFQPRVPGAQWAHGAMGNARWLGVSLRHVLDLAGVRGDAVAVRFGGLDQPLVAGAPDFEKSLVIEHARDGEVMLAFAMNGEQLPMLNGFPLRLVVPGWYSTYWVKMLNDIEVLAAPDDRYWMEKAYKIPTTPGANVVPGAKGFPTVPIGAMVPRSWVTSLGEGQEIAFEPSIPLGGIAMGGDHGVARVDVSSDGGHSWRPATLGPDHGKYSFRRWDARVPLARPGRIRLMARCTSTAGVTQPMAPVWNPSGFMRANVEVTTILATR
ncbi:molybdopterin-dependent oxidoreductase [Novosphingobium album (ex Liu et al. 2023)]|uniref:Molybdopterin-dependent oxidoreductase n=1 Tax=Novosphingobium album (ex Liu et al. 2023) TaxID=3031130 RepID=A0ABT5WMD6_9SPHN|nr:molybdopterin-dependent oxidoreductase [Novosphingobium album (ex Liu et al. 2023)]MDE8651214.1 molybdopterin-dependent oxidoreductase [Novosphingobium album (ex Liu et al. 2023)]